MLKCLVLFALLQTSIVHASESCRVSDNINEQGNLVVTVAQGHPGDADKVASFYFKSSELAQQAVQSCELAFAEKKCDQSLISTWLAGSCDEQISYSAVRAVHKVWATQGFVESRSDYINFF